MTSGNFIDFSEAEFLESPNQIITFPVLGGGQIKYAFANPFFFQADLGSTGGGRRPRNPPAWLCNSIDLLISCVASGKMPDFSGLVCFLTCKMQMTTVFLYKIDGRFFLRKLGLHALQTCFSLGKPPLNVSYIIIITSIKNKCWAWGKGTW